MAGSSEWRLELTVHKEFEECLDLSWQLTPRHGSVQDKARPRVKNNWVEMALDRSGGKDERPPKDAMIKKVDMGVDMKSSIHNMPEARRFFIAACAQLHGGGQLRSPWAHAQTLDPKTRDKDLLNLDPMNKPRLNCQECPCPGYVPIRWTQFVSAEKLRCRRCGCPYDRHLAVDIGDILKTREEKACKYMAKDKIVPLPGDALKWDEREDALWFLTEGALHPRRTSGEGRPPLPEDVGPGGPEGLDGRKGRVSVVTPTTESRRKFHEALWTCFVSQKWPDKELVIVETYFDTPSDFFEKKAKADPRVVYVKFKRPKDADWSIGLKRNIGAHLASGEFIANFDDDDLYAPTYLTSMVGQLEWRRAQAVTLSSWFVVDSKTYRWSFCDPIAWGVARGLDENAPKVRSWAYGYGFSYLNRRRCSLEFPYDDRNMGEDFSFITRLQLKRTEESVQLVHDDFGICVHTQHGQNTSETFPIREVSPEEALDLDVAELQLASHLIRDDRTGEPITASRGSSRRQQELQIHTLEGLIKLHCPVGSTVDALLARLSEEAEREFTDFKVHRVPTALQAHTQAREEAAVALLGVASVFEEVLKEAEARHAPDVEADPAVREAALRTVHGEIARGRHLVLQRAKYAMRGTDRIPPRTTDLWLVLPGEGAEEEEPCEVNTEATDETLLMVEVECQKSSAKKYLASSRTLKVMVPHGSEVSMLRWTLGGDMPPTSRVLVEGREHPLQDNEKLPAKVTITEFVGKRSLYARLSRSQCAWVLDMMRSYFEQPEMQAKLDEIDEMSGQDEFKHKLHLSDVLMTTVYPNILRHFNFPCNKSEGLALVPSAMGEVSMHLELMEMQLAAEKIMRNIGAVRYCYTTIAQMRAQLGLPPLEAP